MGGLGWEFGLRMRALIPPGESARLLARRAQHPKFPTTTPWWLHTIVDSVRPFTAHEYQCGRELISQLACDCSSTNVMYVSTLPLHHHI